LLTFVKTLPKGVEISQHHREQARGGYIVIMVGGRDFYIPVTKEAKKLFGITVNKGKLYVKNHRVGFEADDFLRCVVGALLLQVRDDVCAGMESRLMQEVQEGLENLFRVPISKRIGHEVDSKLFPVSDVDAKPLPVLDPPNGI